VERLQRLADACLAISVASTVPDVLQRVVEALGTQCDAQYVSVRVYARSVAEPPLTQTGGAPVKGGHSLRLSLSSRDATPLGECELQDVASFGTEQRATGVLLVQMASMMIGNIQLVDALREQERRKDQFIATLAHELRNPLTPIVNAASMLERIAPTHRGVAQARETIDRQSHQLVRIIDDLMDVSRVSQDRIHLRLDMLPLREVLDLAIESVRPQLIASRLDFTAHVPDDRIQLHADRSRLAQVITNLLTNAIKFTPTGGQVEMRVTREPGHVRIEISDTGVGIPTDQLEHVFDMFARVPGRDEHSPGGLGIGLALARRLVLLHGGTLVAHSRGLGTGSSFVLSLPQAAGDSRPPANAVPSANAAARPQRPPTVGRSVLVVDDNVDAADSLALLLEREGHQVFVAYDGRSAVDMHAKHRPDAVVMDIGLPGMDGYDAARTMREAQGSDKLLIIALTGWGQAEDRRRSEAAGFDHHLVKPVMPSEIQALLIAAIP
jgi:signal transduction histidine kinase